MLASLVGARASAAWARAETAEAAVARTERFQELRASFISQHRRLGLTARPLL